MNHPRSWKNKCHCNGPLEFFKRVNRIVSKREPVNTKHLGFQFFVNDASHKRLLRPFRAEWELQMLQHVLSPSQDQALRLGSLQLRLWSYNGLHVDGLMSPHRAHYRIYKGEFLSSGTFSSYLSVKCLACVLLEQYKNICGDHHHHQGKKVKSPVMD